MPPPAITLLAFLSAAAAAAGAGSTSSCLGTVAGVVPAKLSALPTTVLAPVALAFHPHFNALFYSSASPKNVLIMMGNNNTISIFAGGVEGVYAAGTSGVASQLPLAGLSFAVDRGRENSIYVSGGALVQVVSTVGLLSTFAGTGVAGYGGDGGQALAAALGSACFVFVGPDGAVYLSDQGNAVVRRIAYGTNVITRVAGTVGSAGYTGDGGAALAAQLSLLNTGGAPLAVASSGAIYMCNSDVIRMIDPAGVITTIAGNPLWTGDGFLTTTPNGDGGPARLAHVGYNVGLFLDEAAGILYIANNSPWMIVRAIDLKTGIMFAALGNYLRKSKTTGVPGPAANASLVWPTHGALTMDSAGGLYTTSEMRFIVKRTAAGNAELVGPYAAAAAVAVSGPGAPKALATPMSCLIDAATTSDNSLIVQDSCNGVIRKVTALGVTSVVGGSGNWGPAVPGPALKTSFNFGWGLTVGPNDVIYTADQGNCVIQAFNLATGTASIVAGNATLENCWTAAPSGTGGAALSAVIASPLGVAVSKAGVLYFAEINGHSVRAVALTGLVVGIAGTFVAGYSGDGAQGTLAQLRNPYQIALSPDDATLVIADRGNHAVRAVTLATGVIRTVAGVGGQKGYSGDGGLGTLALLNNPSDVAVSAAGHIYIADSSNNLVRVVDAAGGITTVAGKPGVQGAVDAPLSTAGQLNNPLGLGWGQAGELYIADNGHNLLRVMPFAAPTVCPPGYACSCGRNPSPCTDATTLCPANSALPFNVTEGFISTTVAPLYAVDAALKVRGSQAVCPIGAYCTGGVLRPCAPGSYGAVIAQSHQQDCNSCAAGSYIAEAGAVGSPSVSPCLRCPAGTAPSAAGAAQCALCPPGTHRGPTGSACLPCPSATFSLFGDSACAPRLETDGSVFIAQTGVLTYQRLEPVQTLNLSTLEILTLTLKATLAIGLCFALPYVAILLMLRYGLCPKRIEALCSEGLKWVDNYSLRKPKNEGEAPVMARSVEGGAITLLSLGLAVALMSSTVINYTKNNTSLASALMPVTQPALLSYQELSNQVLLASTFPERAAEEGGLPPVITAHAGGAGKLGKGSGLTVTISTMGSLCAALQSNSTSFNLFKGAFAYSTSLSPATGLARHVFTCADCSVSDLSYLSVALDRSCQSLEVSVMATGAGGGATVSSLYVAPDTPKGAVSLLFPLTLEVIQDTSSGAQPRDSDGLVTGGRSASAYLVNSPSTVAVAPLAADARAVTLTIGLQLQGAFVMYSLSPTMTLEQFASSLAAWLTVLGVGAIIMEMHESASEMKESSKGCCGAKSVAPVVTVEDHEAQGALACALQPSFLNWRLWAHQLTPAHLRFTHTYTHLLPHVLPLLQQALARTPASRTPLLPLKVRTRSGLSSGEARFIFLNVELPRGAAPKEMLQSVEYNLCSTTLSLSAACIKGQSLERVCAFSPVWV